LEDHVVKTEINDINEKNRTELTNEETKKKNEKKQLVIKLINRSAVTQLITQSRNAAKFGDNNITAKVKLAIIRILRWST